MLRETIIDIFENIWPMLFIFSIVLVSIRLVYLYEKKEPVILYKELLNLLFILYILCLFHVVTFQDVSWSSSNFVPFKEMFRYEIGSRLFFKNVVGNILMFIPYGFFTSYIIKAKKKSFVLLLILIASITVETTQFWIGRVFDIDDILLNLLGGIVGYLIYRVLFNLREKLPKRLKKVLFYNIMFIVLIIVLILYFSKVISFGV
ncbi:MAG: VanZ family protein [Bacilli bacterium]